MDMEEGIISHLLKKLGIKETSEFYKLIADGKLDVNDVIEKYLKIRNHLQNNASPIPAAKSAKDYNYTNPDEKVIRQHEDVLVIDRNLKGLDFSLAKCCHPIYGDSVHRTDCPNASELRKRFGYRIVKARWSGKGASQYAITLRIIGNDDIGIVNNITNVVSKEEKIVMRAINIDSNDGLFKGNLVIQLDDTSRLNTLIKKLRAIKGIRQVERI